ncbi:hypothetical protein F383_08968 [Gossypium arboreum]|uniref:Uncharacterized protein n=1 Tax=Gossypium arboreum TaxID=29729 RepID=A0A0B0PQ94_GOSAR|nr:hypothetical protein F383_08968 [Gossypium arboreum]
MLALEPTTGMFTQAVSQDVTTWCCSHKLSSNRTYMLVYSAIRRTYRTSTPII